MPETSGTSGTPVRPQVFKVLCTAIGRMTLGYYWYTTVAVKPKKS